MYKRQPWDTGTVKMSPAFTPAIQGDFTLVTRVYTCLLYTSHYPDAADDPQFMEAIVDRSQRNVMRDKNAASVVVWSLGNESGYGENRCV